MQRESASQSGVAGESPIAADPRGFVLGPGYSCSAPDRMLSSRKAKAKARLRRRRVRGRPFRSNEATAWFTRLVTAQSKRYALVVSPTTRRQLAEKLPEAVAIAAHEFIIGPLLDNPYRVGTRLRAPLDDRHSARRRTYRVIYRIDDERRTVSVLDVAHRRLKAIR